MKYILNFDDFLNESHANDNFWKDELTEFAFFLGEENYDFEISYSASENDPYIIVNGKMFPISFMDNKDINPETSIADTGIKETILIVHSEDNEDLGATYTIGTGKDGIEDTYQFIENIVFP